VKHKTHETHVKTYFVPYPTDQPLAARNMFLSPLHNNLADSGALFGVSGGWERPQMFLTSQYPVLPYDWYGYYGHTPHQQYPYKEALKAEYARWEYGKEVSKAIESECKECRASCVIFDNSSFGKILISGPDALAGLEWLSTNTVGRSVGSCVYTLMLNDDGGVECDLTITRTHQDKFYLVTGSAALEHTLHWLARGLSDAGFTNLKIEDVTPEKGIINLQGPDSRDILAQLIPGLETLAFSQSMSAVIAGTEVLVVRLTYVGELGYELHVPADKCELVLAEVQGVRQVRFAGMEAMESMAVEKGYRHWPADITQVDNPREAGMGWVCRTKEKKFRGLEKLLQTTNKTMKKKLICLSLEPDVPLNGSEPMICNGEVVGYIRRAASGYTVSRMIGYGYAEGVVERGVDLEQAIWEVNVGGNIHRAEIHKQSLYDPKGEKLHL